MFGMAGVDPRFQPNAVGELERAVKELGLKGLSIDLDTFRLYPNDKVLYPLFEKLQELGAVVVFTMGPLVGRWADPALVDYVAEDFPNLNIVLSHGVYPNPTEYIALAYRRDNVYLEASIYQFLPGAQPVIEAANSILSDRIIYASAFPMNPIDTLKRFMQLPISEENMEKVLYQNAARILNF